MKNYNDAIIEAFENKLDFIGNFWVGDYSSIETIIAYNARNASQFRMTLIARSESDPANAQLLNLLMGIKNANKKLIPAVNVDNKSCTLILSSRKYKKLLETFEAIRPVYSYLNENGYVSVCQSCGQQKEDLSFYKVNREYAYLCEECAQELENSYSEHKIEMSSKTSNLFLGILGALMGASVGIALHMFIYDLGFIWFITGLVISQAAIFGYKKLGGTLDKKGAIAVSIITFISLFLANRFSWTMSAYQTFKNWGWRFSEVFNELPELLEANELTGTYIREMLFTILIGMVTSISSTISSFRISEGDYVFEKLSIMKKQ